MSKKKHDLSHLDGILLIHKSVDISSANALNVVKRNCSIRSLGHAGTLDPFAEGLLIACVEGATKLVSYFQDLPKIYEATFKLGEQRDTDDLTGTVIKESDQKVTLEEIQKAVTQFKGEINQIPPFFSALKVDGKRAYDLARQNKEFSLKERSVNVSSFSVDAFNEEEQEVKVTIECSKGTYIRSIARDLGLKLGTFGYVKTLMRTHTGVYNLKAAKKESEILPEDIIPLEEFFKEMPSVFLKAEFENLVFNGASISNQFVSTTSSAVDGYIPSFYRLYRSNKDFLGIVDNRSHKLIYRNTKNIPL